ncbi:hypothetical protein GCM10009536_34710 [Streptomyces thermocarboxydus]
MGAGNCAPGPRIAPGGTNARSWLGGATGVGVGAGRGGEDLSYPMDGGAWVALRWLLGLSPLCAAWPPRGSAGGPGLPHRWLRSPQGAVKRVLFR